MGCGCAGSTPRQVTFNDPRADAQGRIVRQGGNPTKSKGYKWSGPARPPEKQQ